MTLCEYYIVISDTLIVFWMFYVLLGVTLSELHENTRRKDWVTEKSTEIVYGTSLFFAARPPSYIIFCRFFLLLPHFRVLQKMVRGWRSTACLPSVYGSELWASINLNLRKIIYILSAIAGIYEMENLKYLILQVFWPILDSMQYSNLIPIAYKLGKTATHLHTNKLRKINYNLFNLENQRYLEGFCYLFNPF